MIKTAGQNNLETIERARRVTAAENYDIGTRFPGVYERCDGSWMIDVEGKRVLDVTAASGSVLLGNGHPKIVEAVTKCIQDYSGGFASTITPTRIELAERLCERYPAGEKAVFFRTGSCATTAAIRLARAYTGRDLILSSGYHGWHEWQLSYLSMGYYPASRVANFGYNETALKTLLDQFGSDVAGVIVTPEPAWLDVDYYQRLSDMCEKHDVPFIIDEVITGVRWGARGVNGTGGVRADMITLSKGLSNGHALAPVLGRREIIDAYDKAGLAGTYTREVLPMRIAMTVLDEMDSPDFYNTTQAMGRKLKDGMRDVLKKVGIPAYVTGPDLMFDVVVESEELSWEIYRAAFDYGAYFEDSGTQMVTGAFTDAEVQHALNAFEKGAQRVAEKHGFKGGELPKEKIMAFPLQAFGGSLEDTDAAMKRLSEIVDEMSKRDRHLVRQLDPVCG